MPTWTSPHGRRLPAPGDRTLIMGVLNVTPDSFSDGGLHLEPAEATDRAGRMLAEGADIIDIGGESTRPGAKAVTTREETDRVLPLLARIRETFPDAPVSIDTYKAEVARAALENGADVINDVWGLTAGLDESVLVAWRRAIEGGSDGGEPDPSPMARTAADWGCPVIAMHNRTRPEYTDFWQEFLGDVQVSLALARQAGIARHQIWLDPGFGFGKRPRHNLEVLKHLDRLTALGFPVLLGTSRKSTIGLVLDRPVDRRLEGTAATVVWGIARGCRMVRVHDVAEMRPYIDMADAIRRGINYPDT